MKNLKMILAVTVVLTASASFACADTISGILNITGSDSYTSAGAITFDNPAQVADGSVRQHFGVFIALLSGSLQIERRIVTERDLLELPVKAVPVSPRAGT